MKTPDELRKEFWLDDAQKGGVVRRQYDEIKRVLSQKDYSWCISQYEKIKKHAVENVPFYHELNPGKEFPILNKMQILEKYDNHRALNGFDTPIHVSTTSGSTGTPFAVEQNYSKRQRTIADLQVFGELCDYQPRERMIFFRVRTGKTQRTSEQEEIENIFYVDSSDLSAKHLKEMVDTVIVKRPLIIFSYASTLVELAKYVLAQKINKELFTMNSVLTAGEGISEGNRLMVQEAFGCPVYRRYSDMELGILGQDMGDGGEYTLNWGSYFFECIKLDSDVPTEDGEVGRIVITDLFNYAFPMIRYDTGDLGIMSRKENKLPAFKEILGRRYDCIYSTDGRLLSSQRIFALMWGVSGIKQWQFIQETEQKYTMKINPNGVVDELLIAERLKKLLGKDSIIQFEYVDEIPVLSSNKRRAVICNLKND